MVSTYLSGYSVYAELKVGANGTDTGIAELASGDSAGGFRYGYKRWDDDVSDGVDSSWVPVRLVAEPGGVTWTVGQEPPVHLTSAFGDILSLKVRAAVNGADRQSSWRDLVVRFYDSQAASAPTEQLTLSRASNPVASTLSQTSESSAEKMVSVMPEGTGYPKIELTANVRLQSLAPGVMPGPESMFGQVYLFTAAPAPQMAPPPTVYLATANPVTGVLVASTASVLDPTPLEPILARMPTEIM